MFYVLQLAVVAAVTIPLALLTTVLGLIDRHGKFVYRINQFWTWIILRIAGVTLRVRGLENIDPRRQYVFMVNHQSNIDIPVLVQSLIPFQLRWIAKKELLRVPFFGWAMWATKHITVDRSDPLDAMRNWNVPKLELTRRFRSWCFLKARAVTTANCFALKKADFCLP